MVVEVQPWLNFLRRSRPSVNWQEAGTVLTIDPGETTGWAIFHHGQLSACGQWDTPNPAAMAGELGIMLDAFDPPPERIVYEEYRIRGNRAQEHVGSEVVTIQNIGALKVVADQFEVLLTKQSAGMAKGFATDTKLRRWGLYQKGARHATDAIRHGIYFHLFAYGRKDPRRAANDQGQDT